MYVAEDLEGVHASELREKLDFLSLYARLGALLLSFAAVQNFEMFISLLKLNSDMQQHLGPYR
jgi:hypothetical protein